MDERQRILKLLKDNIISVEEAEILLKAMENKEPKEKTKPKDETVVNFEKQFEQFSNQLGTLVKESLKIVEEKMDEIFKKDTKDPE